MWCELHMGSDQVAGTITFDVEWLELRELVISNNIELHGLFMSFKDEHVI